MKKHIITIAGRPGSGKSITSKKLARELGFEHFSSGDLFRKLGEEQGLDVLHTNLNAEQNKSIDLAVDAKLREIGETQDNLVIDSRTAWHWMPQSFKVFLNLDLDVAAQRIIANMDEERMKSENVPGDNHAYALQLQERLDSETRRYKSLYEIDPYDTANYDLVVDTDKNSIDDVVAIIRDAYQRWIS